MYASFEYDGLLAKFCNILAIWTRRISRIVLVGENGRVLENGGGGGRTRLAASARTRVRVLRGCFALVGSESMSMYACGVTIAGLTKRRKKKPPMREQMA